MQYQTFALPYGVISVRCSITNNIVFVQANSYNEAELIAIESKSVKEVKEIRATIDVIIK